jgi:hypothetical protein|tara:strand:+ start:44 stop:178 length:135 start_codon:yes stop_codon:yes gene_type:complete
VGRNLEKSKVRPRAQRALKRRFEGQVPLGEHAHEVWTPDIADRS